MQNLATAPTGRAPEPKLRIRFPQMPDRERLLNRLTLLEIADKTGMHISTLGRYMRVPIVREIMGADGKPPTYPEDSLSLFHRLNDLHQAKVVTPQTIAGTAAVLLRDETPQIQNSISDSQALVPNAQVPVGLSPEQFSDLLEGAVFRAVASALREERLQHAAPPPDQALTRQQAAALLGCSPGSVRRYVEPLRRGRYSALMVQRVLAAQRAAAEGRQAGREQKLGSPPLPPGTYPPTGPD